MDNPVANCCLIVKRENVIGQKFHRFHRGIEPGNLGLLVLNVTTRPAGLLAENGVNSKSNFS